MGLNTSKGNMYDFVTHTWNTVKGKCSHNCGYCYMKRFGNLKEAHFDEKELKTDLGSGNFIFVGSSNDLFSENIPKEWIFKTLNHCAKYDNKYLLQSKNPKRILDKYLFHPLFIEGKAVVCTTIESNRYYVVMRNAPAPIDRAKEMSSISISIPTYVTIEPIMDFDLEEMVKTIELCHPTQVNIGTDTGNNQLPEPTKEKVEALIVELNKFTTINRKSNLKRILG